MIEKDLEEILIAAAEFLIFLFTAYYTYVHSI